MLMSRVLTWTGDVGAITMPCDNAGTSAFHRAVAQVLADRIARQARPVPCVALSPGSTRRGSVRYEAPLLGIFPARSGLIHQDAGQFLVVLTACSLFFRGLPARL